MRPYISAVGKIRMLKFLHPLLKRFNAKGKMFSAEVQTTIMHSREEALRRGHDSIRLAHLMLAILKSAPGRTHTVLETLHCDIANLQQEIERAIINYPGSAQGTNLPFSKQMADTLGAASNIAADLNSGETQNEHLLLAILLQEDNLLAPLFKNHNLNYPSCRQQLTRLMTN